MLYMSSFDDSSYQARTSAAAATCLACVDGLLARPRVAPSPLAARGPTSALSVMRSAHYRTLSHSEIQRFLRNGMTGSAEVPKGPADSLEGSFLDLATPLRLGRFPLPPLQLGSRKVRRGHLGELVLGPSNLLLPGDDGDSMGAQTGRDLRLDPGHPQGDALALRRQDLPPHGGSLLAGLRGVPEAHPEPVGDGLRVPPPAPGTVLGRHVGSFSAPPGRRSLSRLPGRGTGEAEAASRPRPPRFGLGEALMTPPVGRHATRRAAEARWSARSTAVRKWPSTGVAGAHIVSQHGRTDQRARSWVGRVDEARPAQSHRRGGRSHE